MCHRLRHRVEIGRTQTPCQAVNGKVCLNYVVQVAVVVAKAAVMVVEYIDIHQLEVAELSVIFVAIPYVVVFKRYRPQWTVPHRNYDLWDLTLGRSTWYLDLYQNEYKSCI